MYTCTNPILNPEEGACLLFLKKGNSVTLETYIYIKGMRLLYYIHQMFCSGSWILLYYSTFIFSETGAILLRLQKNRQWWQIKTAHCKTT